MSNRSDFALMSDPDFLAERKRVREELQELTERYRKLNEEFDRRRRPHGRRQSVRRLL
jgi:hypothetical protein